MPNFATFRVLLDDPAKAPALGFSGYADALAQIVQHSDAQFAVGIFGEWGSGKTTLMRAVETRLRTDPTIVPVWFNAWRYEREPHLIVPLLDTLRQALVDWASDPVAPDPGGRARRAASAIARAAKALLAGASVSGSLPGLSFSVDGEKILENLEAPDDDAADEPQSFYHAGFRAMRGAVREFAYDAPNGQGRVDRRIVVFVDDLDRCLPINALAVLESMKVLFDLEGFVFVVGLAESVIDQAVRIKYSIDATSSDATTIRGPEYRQKLFQVPFALPRIRTDQLPEYFGSLVTGSDLPPDQVTDLNTVVAPHVGYLSGDDTVNPREIKRFINSYTIQMKMLAGRVGQPNPNIVLALQVMSFRWRNLYELLAADTDQFREAVREILERDDTTDLWIGDEREPVPVAFLAYARAEGAPLLADTDLGPYVTSAEFTRTTDPDLREAQAALRDLRRVVADLRSADTLDSETFSQFQKSVELLGSRTISREGPLANDLHRQTESLRRLTSEIDPNIWADRSDTWLAAIDESVRAIGRILSELRRVSNVVTAS